MSRSFRKVDPRSKDFRNCARKKAFKDAHEARAAVKKANRANKHRDYPTLKAYHCPVCGLYHFTKRKSWEASS